MSGESTSEERQLLAQLRDPNLRFPDQPQLVPDIHTFQMPDGLGVQFRGAEQPVVIRGRLAAAVLTALLPRLDGTRTVETLLQESPPALPRATVLRALALLHSKGLLIVGVQADESAAGVDPVARRQALFWGRHLDLTRSARTAGEVDRRLATTRIVIIGTGLFGLATFDLLTRSGVAAPQVIAWGDDGLLGASLAASPVPPSQFVHLDTTAVDSAAGQLRAWLAGADLIITATGDAPAALFRAINRLCLAAEVPWLRGNFDGSRAEVGPFVQPYNSGCYRCLELREASRHGFAIEEHLYQEGLATAAPATTRIPQGEAVWSATLVAALLVGEAIRILSGIAAPTLLNAVLQVLPVSGALQTDRFLRVPRCPDCYRGEIPPHPAAPTLTRATQ